MKNGVGMEPQKRKNQVKDQHDAHEHVQWVNFPISKVGTHLGPF